MNQDTNQLDLAKLKSSVESIGGVPSFDQNLLFALERKYLDFLDLNDKEHPFPLEDNSNNLDVGSSVRMVKIALINHLESNDIGLHLQNFYNLLATLKAPHHTVFGIIKGLKDQTEIYYGIAENKHTPHGRDYIGIQDYFDHNFTAAFKSNFSGVRIKDDLDADKVKEILSIKDNDNVKITALPGIPSVRLKNNDNEYFQGIDRFIEGMQGTEYDLLVIAEPIHLSIINAMIKNLMDLSSAIHSFVKQTINKTKGSSDTLNIGLNIGVGDELLSKLGIMGLKQLGVNIGYSRNWFRFTSVAVENLDKIAEYSERICNKYIERLQAGKNLGFWNAGVYMISGNDYIQHRGTSLLESILSGDETHYEPLRSIPLSKEVWEKYLSQLSNPRYKVFLYGDENFIKDKLRYDNLVMRLIKNNKREEEQYKNEFLGYNETKQKKILNDLQSDKNLMKEVEQEVDCAWEVLKEKETYAHPLGSVMGGVSTPLNTEELAIIMNLPRKQVTGIPVIQKTEFGRNIRSLKEQSETEKNSTNEKTYDIGELRYLGIGENNRLKLDKNSLASHTFITGTTGSGKTNTVYNILTNLHKDDLKFLVIEPVKGEYKNTIGGLEGIQVFGTNREYTPLLRINPFKFPPRIHVLEHLDRLIEIFNACWPMYAAMPALMKESLEEAYRKRAWDLEESKCLIEPVEYPTISDVVKIMPEIVKQSGYSAEVQANYYGALVTRLKSLTNGLYRWIFCEDEIDELTLFDSNCIVDISRIGSMETKALIMGILFMRLYEYRISADKPANSNLKHVTVLEEAHHLMRRTSVTQSEEYANIQGKAVEMITNSIAEMRSYGEGFILIDQAPGLLDLTAIRNTNTKIALRLPEQEDKEIVGKSMNLDERQISELSRLETGEAVVYQNDWLQAVSGKIEYYKDEKPFSYKNDWYEIQSKRKDFLTVLLNPLVSESNMNSLKGIDVDKLKNWLQGQPVGSKVKEIAEELIEQREFHEYYQTLSSGGFAKLAKIVAVLSRLEEVIPTIRDSEDIDSWNGDVLRRISKIIELPNNEFGLVLIHLVLYNRFFITDSQVFKDSYQQWEEVMKVKGWSLC
mgnify:CR=1 FL=1